LGDAHKGENEAMSRRPAVITQADVRRVIRAAKQEGATAVEVEPGGKIVIRLADDEFEPLVGEVEVAQVGKIKDLHKSLGVTAETRWYRQGYQAGVREAEARTIERCAQKAENFNAAGIPIAAAIRALKDEP
jgi:hypothetical protein